MNATAIRQQPHLLGVAIYAAFFALGLALAAGWVSLTITGVEKHAWTLVVVTAAMFGGSGGFCLYAGAAVYYQAKPPPLSGARDSLVWQQPLVCRIAIVVVVVAIGTAAVVLGITPDIGTVVGVPLLIFVYAGVVLTCSFCLRVLVMRLEADDWGIRCRNLLSTVRLPWGDVVSLGTRGKSIATQRPLAITKQGRARELWVLDPRVPFTRDNARLLVAELEAVRQSATSPGV
jgi:hypothetical protein